VLSFLDPVRSCSIVFDRVRPYSIVFDLGRPAVAPGIGNGLTNREREP